MQELFQDMTVLVTGGTGSFGSHFVSFLLRETSCKKVVVFSRDELKQYYMHKRIADPRIRFFIGDVRDEKRLARAFAGVDIVVHAAALKQVPLLEYNPVEAVQTNIIGTQHVIEAAIDAGVSKVLLISTDKAAHPANLYGATKLCAERLTIAANSYAPGKTRCAVVRYGNVIGSRGSIIDTLLRQKSGISKVHITHPDMTRFWIRLDQARDLVLFALREMEGGEIFVPKIPTMRIKDLFEALAPDAQQEIMGIRPGEKMHEVLVTEQETRHTIELPDCFVILPEFRPWGVGDYGKYETKGKRMPESFSYSSETHAERLTIEEIQTVVRSFSSL